jgi:hypothetical protein
MSGLARAPVTTELAGARVKAMMAVAAPAQSPPHQVAYEEQRERGHQIGHESEELLCILSTHRSRGESVSYSAPRDEAEVVGQVDSRGQRPYSPELLPGFLQATVEARSVYEDVVFLERSR